MKRILALGAMAAALSTNTSGDVISRSAFEGLRQSYRPPSKVEKLHAQQRAEARAKKAKQRKMRKASRS